jgi:tripartite-type tricarboxylate transporter receptor subunit TctC
VWSRAIRCLAALVIVGAIVAVAHAPARADNYPSKTITIIAPASPGGVTDLLARMLARRFIADWGAQAIVENKPGANNQVAAEYVARQPGDGYTLFIGPETTFIVNPTLYAHLAYDPVKDFTPIAGLVSINHALVLNPSVPAGSVKELIALAKAKPGQLNYGDYGVGSSGNLNMEMFKAVTGVNLVAVHYKGATPALEDVMAGHIQLMFVSAGTAMPQVKAGALKIVGVGAEKRMALLPDVPAIAETVPGFTAVSWFGLFGPAGIAAGVFEKISRGSRRLCRAQGAAGLSRHAIFRIACRLARRACRAHPQRRAEMAQAHPGFVYQRGVRASPRILIKLRSFPRRRESRLIQARAEKLLA